MTEDLSFQQKVAAWVAEAFGSEAKYNIKERSHRFLEESLELYQSMNCTKEEALRLVEYVYSRPAGEVKQEIGGVALTLFSLGDSAGEDVEACAMSELARVWKKIEVIRAKNAAKTVNSPLPGNVDEQRLHLLSPGNVPESCGNCGNSILRATDRKGRSSSEYATCSLGSISTGNHIRRTGDWCDQWREKQC